ncbi:hypothetical protein HDU96_003972 [Phlyctochytrium bullatum]|nr:hypothetical protein HDU96_003972 [Phlyctochytrium bullatum]
MAMTLPTSVHADVTTTTLDTPAWLLDDNASPACAPGTAAKPVDEFMKMLMGTLKPETTPRGDGGLSSGIPSRSFGTQQGGKRCG